MEVGILLSLFPVVACLFLACVGCRREMTRKPLRPENGVVAVSLLTLDNPHFRQIGESITGEGRRLGFEVEVLSGDFDVARQQEQVKRFIAQRVKAIVLSPCDSLSIGPAIRAANTAEIPVFTVDIACRAPDAKIVTHVATDNYGGGKQAAHAMIEALGERSGRVAIIDHTLIESCVLRVKGFKEIVDKHNAERAENKRLVIVVEQPGGAAYEGGVRAATVLGQANLGLDGVFAVNDPSALGAYHVFSKKSYTGRRPVLVGFDGSPEGKEAVNKGILYATPIQYPDQIGVELMHAIVRHFKGDALPTEMLIPTSLYGRNNEQVGGKE